MKPWLSTLDHGLRVSVDVDEDLYTVQYNNYRGNNLALWGTKVPVLQPTSEEAAKEIKKLKNAKAYPFLTDEAAGERFKKWLKESGYSQYDLSKIWGVSESTVTNRLNNPKTIRVWECVIIEYLIGEEALTDICSGEGAYQKNLGILKKQNLIKSISKNLEHLTIKELEVIDTLVSARSDAINERPEHKVNTIHRRVKRYQQCVRR